MIQQIQHILTTRNITIYRLSKMTGIDQPTIHSLFRTHNAELKTLEKICFALDVEIIVKPKI